MSGVTVTAYDKNGNAVGNVTSAADGSYTINPSAAGPYRVVFSNLPSGYEPTTHGNDNGTSVQFVTDASQASTVNLGILPACDYCQNDVPIVLSKFPLLNATVNSRVILSSLPYMAGSNSTTTATGYNLPIFDNGGQVIDQRESAQTGPLFGISYHRLSGAIYASQYMRRHVAFGADGPGAIYRVTYPGNALTLAYTIPNAGPNPHDTTDYRSDYLDTIAGEPFTNTWDAVGKTSLGGLQWVEDLGNPTNDRLYVVNMYDRQLYQINPNTGAITAFAIPGTTGGGIAAIAGDGTCPATDVRPFGVGVKQNTLYVGLVCSAQSTQNTSDLHAYVYSFDGASFGAMPVLNFPLDYTRNGILNGGQNGLNVSGSTNWRPWSTVYKTLSADPHTAYPQPTLSDIEFDGDVMLLGLRDRLADQASGNSEPGFPNDYRRATSAGDLLRAYPSGANWNIEGAANHSGSQNNNQGPGGGEFYDQDRYPLDGNPINHDETSTGALMQIPGYGDVVTTVYDPHYTDGQYDRQGLRWYSNSTGQFTRGYQVTDEYLTSKSNGLGDIEALCNPAPVEIGNRVWDDLNGNGIQDPGEPGINGLTVSRQGPTNTVTVVTSDDGNYYFDVSRTTAYTLTITPPSGYSVTTPNAQALAGASVSSNHAISDTIDSDALLVSGAATIYYTSGSAGQNNHGLDFGFTQPVSGQVDILNIAPPAPANSDYGDAPDSYGTLATSNGPSHGIASILRIGAQIDSEADGQPSALADGDDTNDTPDDEDGVQFKTPLRPGANGIIAIGVQQPLSSTVRVNGWIDFNQDGDFADGGEHIATDVASINGNVRTDTSSV